MNSLECVNGDPEDDLEDINDNFLENIDNVDVGMRYTFYICRRRRRVRKPRQSIKFVCSFVVRGIILESSSVKASHQENHPQNIANARAST